MPRPRHPYQWLLRLYPRAFRERYGAQMAQTFADLDRERRETGRSSFLFLTGVFAETGASIVKENIDMLSITARQLRLAAFASLALLAVPLILTLANPASRLRGGAGGGGFDWMPGSFVVMGAMLFAVSLGVQWAARRLTTRASRSVAIAAIVAVFGLAWVELAVDGVSQVVGLFAFASKVSGVIPAFPLA
ncbi:MAG: hypothetical protein AAF692_05150 [Pseudomonadota bacterium]